LFLYVKYEKDIINQPQLIWTASPLSSTAISSPNNVWIDVPDTSISLELKNEASVLISYDAQVQAVKDFTIAEINREECEIGFRVVVDEIPYRQSGSSVGDFEPLVNTISGYLVTELSAGKHVVKLQWRKIGVRVSTWVITNEVLDGFVGGRNLVVSAQHRKLWSTQPLGSAFLSSVDKWEQIPEMTVQFRSSEKGSYRFFYQVPVRPDSIQFSRGTSYHEIVYDFFMTSHALNRCQFYGSSRSNSRTKWIEIS
jgi:hypothetical protein